jgi:hypothetical protein
MMTPDEVWTDVIALIENREQWSINKKFRGFNKPQFIKQMMIDFENLYSFCPTLFEKCCEGDFEQEDEFDKLVYMLDMMRKIENKEDTFENVNKSVGKKFADEYINPIVDKLEEKRKKEEEEKKNKIEEVE